MCFKPYFFRKNSHRASYNAHSAFKTQNFQPPSERGYFNPLFFKIHGKFPLQFTEFKLTALPFIPIDLLNVFEVFLPQLLLYPNASDPLNGAAASLYLKDVGRFNQTVQDHVSRHASPEALQKEEENAMDIDDDLSSLGSIGDNEMDDLIFE